MLRTHVNKFNRGEVDSRAIARQDVEKVRDSSAFMENWLPMRLGPMQYRPGTKFIGSLPNGQAYFLPFIAATDDTALLEFTNNQLRVWVSDAVIARTARTATVTNGNFDTDLTGWVDDSSGAGTSAWETGGYAKLTGDGTSPGAMYQTVTITETGQEHGVRIVVVNAPVTLKIGTTVGGEEIFGGEIGVGTHSFAISPASDVTFHFSNKQEYATLIDSIQIEGAGDMTLPTTIPTASLELIRHTQSADVVFLAVEGVKLQRVERRGVRSWSVVDLRADKGPFEVINVTPITMQAGALSGDTTLTASDDFFTADHVGALFKVASTSQNVEATVSAGNNGTGAIRVTGVGNVRRFTIIVNDLSGTGSTVTLQRSTDELNWEDIESYTTNQNKTFDDGLNNAVLFYRLFIKSGDYSSGTIELILNYPSGSIEGIARVTAFTSTTVVSVQVLEDFGSTDPSLDWFEGSWSTKLGYPTAVELYEGRLWFAGKTKVWGSVSDAFEEFGGDQEGDSKTIQKTVGFGPVDAVNWLAPTSRLIMGLATDEVSVRSNSFGEVLTQENANLKAGTNQGSAKIAPIRADSVVYFVQRSKIHLYALAYSIDSDTHQGVDATVLNPEILFPGTKKIAVTRQPETRVFAVLDNGEARVYLVDRSEDVRAWSRITTKSGDNIEDVVVLPGILEDKVYFVVNRSSGRYLEKMAMQRDALGQSDSQHFDSHVIYTSPGTTLTGLSHLEGETIGLWADGEDIGDGTVSGGSVTIPAGKTDVVAGLRYTADCISNRITEYIQAAPHGRIKRVVKAGLIMQDAYRSLIQMGSDEATLEQLPDIEEGSSAPVTGITEVYDELSIELNGFYDTDPRVQIRSTGPATILAWVFEIDDPEHTTASSG